MAMKQFVSQHDDVGNPQAQGTHIAVLRRTTPSQGGRPIPVTQRFLVGGERALGPHGAGLSARNLIRCRCRLGSHIEQAQIQEPLRLFL